ncbi:dihydrolipoyl dehydrogenase [Salinisphaera sp.]|uniref:dihydrolipoyl dehydrogenase family protein n=1 Tax=Salinisphaera sp. TaxID=1914330 RepID=UPI002D776421|nr:dihydrolipoyl dehydrogenase [Salinisphaera sp.]HET7314219.1 dihydrolipoyl dehydrogenase [Salinisphaera sp.]
MAAIQHFDNVVIGAGAGLTAAYFAVQDKQSVALVTDRPAAIGGTCVNFGCIPTKTLIQSARAIDAIKSAADFGIHVDTTTIEVDFTRIMHDMRALRADNAKGARQWVADAMTPFYTRARFVGDKLLETEDGTRLTGERIFIASGARPSIPPIQGLQDAGYWTNEDVLELERQPASLIVVGGGYIGVELGYFFAALGTEVTLINPDAKLLAEDDDVRELFTREFGRRVTLVTGRATRVASTGSGKRVELESEDGETRHLEAEQILIATGRKPNTEHLDLAATGVRVDKGGAIRVDAALCTDHPHIYAYGDVIGRGMFKHTSSAEGELAYRNAQGESQRMDYHANPHAVFSEPEVAAVGLSEAECRSQSLDYRVAKLDYADVAKGKIVGAPAGFAKLLVENTSERILGCHIIGPHAALLIHEVVVAMNADGASVDTVRRAIHIHPSLSELVGTLFG